MASDKVSMTYCAGQPGDFANYWFQLVKGVNGVPLPPPTSGPIIVPLMQLVSSDTVAKLLGPCAVAGFAESIYVATTIQNGWGRQSQYDASATIAFVLSP